MPSRKQRRRRQKERRHEYEYVVVDEEGHEVEVDPAELRQERTKEPRRADGRRPQRQGGLFGRSRGPVRPPSWNRVLRRSALFFPLFFVLFSVLNSKTAVTSRIFLSLLYTLLFIPFMYLMDRTAYRTYLRRSGGEKRR
ncbi:MAG: hypothetical protein WBB74_04775 [Gaiellaceae bacterium]